MKNLSFLALLFFVFPVLCQAGHKIEISGVVFADTNGNGIKEKEEKGLKDIYVSNGIDIIMTGENGEYRLAVDKKLMPFVFIIKPSGLQATKSLFQLCLDMNENGLVDFGLKPCEVSEKLTFFQISDLHCPHYTEATLEKIAPPLADKFMREVNVAGGHFIVNTGDTANQGRKEQFAACRRLLDRFEKCPVYYVAGNHDFNETAANRKYDDLEPYFRYINQPNYYSFNYSDCHFVVLDSCREKDAIEKNQQEWLKKDLKLSGHKYRTVILTHTASITQRLEYKQILEPYNIAVVFCGHNHCNFEWRQNGVLHMITSMFFHFGRGAPFPSYRQITMDGDGISAEVKYLGRKNGISLIGRVEEDGKIVCNGRLFARCVNDLPVAVCEVKIGNNGPWQKMDRFGNGLWVAENFPDTRGKYEKVEIQTVDAEGRKAAAEFAIKNIHEDKPDGRIKFRADWPMFQGGATHQGQAGDSVKPPLSLCWLKKCSSYFNSSSPIICAGKIIVGIWNENLNQNGIMCLSPEGKELWRYATEFPVRQTASCQNGIVVFSTAVGDMHGIDLETGKLLWENKSQDGRCPIFMPHSISGKSIYAATGWDVGRYDLSTGNKLVACGKSGWGKANYISPAVADDCVYHSGGTPEGLVSLKDGKQIWKFEDKRLCSNTSPVFFNGRIFWAADDKIYAFNAENGKLLWQASLGDPRYIYTTPLSTPCVKDKLLFIGSINTGKLLALDIDSGEKIWECQTGDALYPYGGQGDGYQPCVLSSPVISGNIVYSGANDGCLYAIDARTGKCVSRFHIGTPITSSAAISGNAVIVTGLDGYVYAFRGIMEKKQRELVLSK